MLRVMFYLVGIQETVFQVTLREVLQGAGGWEERGSQVVQKFASMGRYSEPQKYFCEVEKTRYLK